MTHGLIIFRDRNGAILFVMYITHDGFPEGIGLDLAHSLMLEADSFECLAAQSASILALDHVMDGSDAGSEAGTVGYNHLLFAKEDATSNYEFLYTVQDPGLEPLKITMVHKATQDVFAGTPAEFVVAFPSYPEHFNTLINPPQLWYDHEASIWSSAPSLPAPIPKASSSAAADPTEQPHSCIALRLCYLDTPGEESVAAEQHLLSLMLDYADWSDYLADLIPSLVRECITVGNDFASELLVHLKRGRGRVLLTSHHELEEPPVPTIRLGFASDETSHIVELRATRPHTAPYEAHMIVRAKEVPVDVANPGDEDVAAMVLINAAMGMAPPTLQSPPPAADLNRTMQPALDGLANYLRPRWTPHTHPHLPREVRERAWALTLVGKALSLRVGYELQDPWRTNVMPEALSAVEVRRPLSEITED